MKMKARAGLWLVALGFALAPPSKAAVMTGNVTVSSGAAPYSISYILAQQAATMSVKIHKSSDGTVIRTISGGDISPDALTLGPHTGGVTWDGKTDGGTAAPAGNYYAEIITTGDPTFVMTELTAPQLMVASLNGTDYKDGRGYYEHGVMTDSSSPFHNDAMIGTSSNGNAGQTSGVQIIYPDGTSGPKYFNPLTPPNASNYDSISTAVTSDGKIVNFGQSTGTVKILNDDGTIYKTMGGSNEIVSRGVRVSGTADAGTAVFVDVGSTGGSVNSIDMISLAGTVIPTPTVLIPSTLVINAAARSIAVRFDSNNLPTAIWVTGWGAGTGGVRKFIPPTGGGTPWVQDTNFNYTPPVDLGITSPTNVFVELSKDGHTLYVAGNKGNTTDQNYIEGVDADTGARDLGQANFLVPTWAPEMLTLTSSGNLYVTNYTGNLTGTTSDRVGIVAPVDNGSSDSTRSFDFLVTSDTQIQITDFQVSDVSYHGAKFTWTTNYPTNSTISYGTTSGAPDQTATDTDLVTSHSITLDNLASGTKFYFTAKSSATGLTDGVTPESSFTTSTLTVSNVQVTNLTDSSAVVTFKTSDPGLGIVRYSRVSGGYDPAGPTLDARHPGEIAARGLPATAAPLSTDHSVTITGLSPNTTYYFVAESGYKPGEATIIFRPKPSYAADSAEASFLTLNTINTTGVSLTTTANAATLNFTTNPASTAVVKWGTAPDSLTNTVNVPSGTSHTASLTGLSAATTYYYTIGLSAPGAASRTSVPNTLVTAVAGGASSTITQSTVADFTSSTRSQIVLGGAAGLVSLEKQGVPGQPVEGPTLPTAARYIANVAYNGYLYALGGYTSTAIDNVYVAPINADGSFGAWTATTSMPSARYVGTNMATAYGGYIYMVAGAGGTAGGNAVFYTKQNADGTLGQWQTANPLPVARDIGSAVALDGVIYMMGGETNTDDQDNRVFQAQIRADGSLGPWTERAALKDGLYLQRAVANAHKIYTFGGITDDVSANYAVADFNTVDIATTQPLQDITPFLRDTDDLGHTDGYMDVLHYSMGAGLLGGKITTVGGRVGTATYHSLISITPINQDGSTGAWQTWAADGDSTAWPFNIRDNDAAVYNGAIYGAGGRVEDGTNTGRAVYVPFIADPNNSGYVYSGNLDSKIMDLGALTNLKHLTVAATGGGVEVRYRFANADGVFTPWLTPASLDADISGAARYFQYQLVLSGNGSSTPAVNSVALTTQAVAPGAFTKTDVENALKIAAGFQSASGADKTKLDVDGDGAVTVKDAVAINREVNS